MREAAKVVVIVIAEILRVGPWTAREFLDSARGHVHVLSGRFTSDRIVLRLQICARADELARIEKLLARQAQHFGLDEAAGADLARR